MKRSESPNFVTPFKPGSDHILHGKPAHNKGKAFPHSPEWTEKRLAASREAMKNKPRAKGYKRPPEHTRSMRVALVEKKAADPEKYRQLALKNLSKRKDGDLSGKGSPNWRGGVTKPWQQWRNANKHQFAKHRQIVLARDGKCKDCGSLDGLEVHHIVPVAECPTAAFLPMNGVALCKACHKKTDSFGGKVSRKFVNKRSGRGTIIVQTIPHRWQAYETVGNYAVTKDGLSLIFVSALGNPVFEQAIVLHELIEVFLVMNRGIEIADIDKFDIAFEAKRTDPNAEPGDDPSAPYQNEYCFATAVERMFIAAMGIKWADYDKACLEA